LSVIKAVSDPEKKADSKIRTNKIIKRDSKERCDKVGSCEDMCLWGLRDLVFIKDPI